MHRLFDKYRMVIMTGIILISLVVVNFAAEGIIKSFFTGVSTGVALVLFVKSIEDIKYERVDNYTHNPDNE